MIETKNLTIALVGTPNCGKSTVFNRLTGASQRIGNFPGVTVERKEGRSTIDGHPVTVVDLPGLYGFCLSGEDCSIDHMVARDFLATGGCGAVINVVDATKLEQSLYLTVQLLEMELPVIVAINLMDAAEKAGLQIDCAELSNLLGCPVVPMVASRGQGVEALKEAIAAFSGAEGTRAGPAYDMAVEREVETLTPLIGDAADRHTWARRWMAVKLLEGDTQVISVATDALTDPLGEALDRIEAASGEDAESLIADGRFEAAHRLAQEVTSHVGTPARQATEMLDRIVLHRWLGVPVFLAVMYAMFTLTVNVGGAFIDFFDIAAGALFVDGGHALLNALSAPEWLTVILADGIGGGIQVVATFIPVVGFLFLILSFLEDSGYMARAAYIMDRGMTAIGLPGKAIVPLIVGFGCNVPAVMATRVLERPHDRIITAAMAPFMSCGARLAVYALFVAAFFPVGGQNVVMGLYLVGIAVAVLTAVVLKKTLMRGEASPLMLELPPYRMPRLRDLLLFTWTRLKAFLIDAGQVIVVVVMVLSFLNSLGTDGSFGNEDSETAVLSAISKTVAPVFAPIGIEENNWPAVVGIVTGVFAKEAVVGTLDALYAPGTGEEGGGLDLIGSFGEALATIPENLSGLGGLLTDPLDLGSVESGGEEVTSNTLTALSTAFDGTLGAVSYLLFVLLYVPCVAVLGAIYRELGWRWMVFVSLWTTGMAYSVATLTYQLGTFSRHPAQSLTWVAVLAGLFAAAIFGLYRLGRDRRPPPGTLMSAAE